MDIIWLIVGRWSVYNKYEKILLITENIGSGGAERQLCGLASMLTKAGFTCRLITYIENQFYEPYLRKNGVDYEFVPKLFDKKLAF